MSVEAKPAEQGAAKFIVMREDGPFSVRHIAPTTHEWLRNVRKYPEHWAMLKDHRADAIATGQIISSLLEISDIAEVSGSLTPGRKAELRRKANRQFTAAYDIDATKEDARAQRIGELFRMADGLIESHLRMGVLEPLSQVIDMTEEVKGSNDIVDLLGIVLNPKYSRRVRFEAKRKLELVKTAASVDAQTRMLREQDKYPDFIRFLDVHVLHSQEGITGETTDVVLLGKYSLDDYSCIAVQELTTEEEVQNAHARIEKLKPEKIGHYLRLTNLPQRHLRNNGRLIPVYISDRRKEPLSRMEKVLRKGEAESSVAVEDMTGLMAVVKDTEDAYLFLDHLVKAGAKSKSVVIIEGIEDNLHGGQYSAENPGSSPKTQMLKFYARVQGIRVEVIVLTYKTYLDYLFKDGVAHEEFELRRLFDSGLFQVLFPQSIYNINPSEVKKLTSYQRRVKRLNYF